MHELSIALSITEGVLEESRRRGGLRVSAVHLKLGELAGVDADALLFAYGAATDGTPLAGTRLEIERVPATGFCAVCGQARTPESLQHAFCSICEAPLAEIRSGRELEISALEVQE